MAEPHEDEYPLTVTVVSFGYESGFGQDFIKHSEGTFHHLDVREFLHKDPSSVVGHNENGTFAQTQMCVFGQEGFPQLTTKILDLVGKGCRCLALGCRKGNHRSDTTGRCVEDILNLTCNEKGTGQRIYNCKHFSLNEAYGWKGFRAMQNDIEAWMQDPWHLADGGYRERRCRYAYEACMRSKSSAKGWTTIHSGVEAVIMESEEEVKSEDDPEEVLTPTCKVKPHPPMLPPPPVPGWLDNKKEQPVKEESVRGAKRGRAASSDEDDAWVTFSQDASVWNSLLVEAGVDKSARQELLLLAQHSTTGHEEANSIIGKILKKRSDKQDMHNTSAFVHRCVCNARQTMGSWRWSSESDSGGKSSAAASGKSSRW